MKKWLENNKIYFEVFSSLALGTCAVVIAYLSYKFSVDTYENELAKEQPQIDIINTITGDSGKLSEVLNISNGGGDMHNIEIYYRSYLYAASHEKPYKMVCIDADDYFSVTNKTNNKKGLVATISGIGNLSKYSELDPEGVSVPLNYNNTGMETYLSISYFNATTQRKTDYYYFASSQPRSKKISKEEFYEKRFKRTCKHTYKSFYKLNHKDIEKTIMESPEVTWDKLP